MTCDRVIQDNMQSIAHVIAIAITREMKRSQPLSRCSDAKSTKVSRPTRDQGYLGTSIMRDRTKSVTEDRGNLYPTVWGLQADHDDGDRAP